MQLSDCFVSVVTPCTSGAAAVVQGVERIANVLASHYSFFEVVVVSDDLPLEGIGDLLARHEGLRLIRLAGKRTVDVCASAGIESAIGDVVVIMDPVSDPPEMLPELVRSCQNTGAVYYGISSAKPKRRLRNLGATLFHWYCRRYLGIDIQRGAALFRVLSRAATNNFLQIKDRSRLLRLMTANLGLKLVPFPYAPCGPTVASAGSESLFDDMNVAFDILSASSRHPLRWVSRLGIVAAFINVLYAFYVLAIYVFKHDVAPGWATLSLQTSLMFFLLFLLAVVLCEYVGKLLIEVQEKPVYTVIEERNSSVLVNPRKRLNVVTESEAS